MNTMEYKGYTGNVNFSENDACFFGKVLGIKSLISYEGTNAEELISDFHNAIDDYLEMCKAENIIPEKPYKGSFNVRISPELHKKCALYALSHNITLNKFVEQSLEKALSVLL